MPNSCIIPINTPENPKSEVTLSLSWAPKNKRYSFFSELKKDITKIFTNRSYGLDFFFSSIGLLHLVPHEYDPSPYTIKCFIYDRDKVLLTVVDSTTQSDESRKIYYTGNNTNGYLKENRENIRLELCNLPENYHALIMALCFQTKTTDKNTALLKIENSKTEATLYEMQIQNQKQPTDEAYIIGRIFSENALWFLETIDRRIPNTKNITELF